MDFKPSDRRSLKGHPNAIPHKQMLKITTEQVKDTMEIQVSVKEDNTRYVLNFARPDGKGAWTSQPINPKISASDM